MRGIESCYPSIERRHHIGQALTARVVQVRRTGFVADLALQPREHPSHLRGVRIPGTVGKSNAVGTRRNQHQRHLHDPVFRHGALNGAAKGGGNAHFDLWPRQRRAVAQFANQAHLFDGLFWRHVDVALTVGARRRHRHGHLMRTRRDRQRGVLEIGCQREHVQSGNLPRMLHDFGGVGHLRQQLGRYKRADFNFPQARRRQRLDPAMFRLRGHDGFDTL